MGRDGRRAERKLTEGCARHTRNAGACVIGVGFSYWNSYNQRTYTDLMKREEAATARAMERAKATHYAPMKAA